MRFIRALFAALNRFKRQPYEDCCPHILTAEEWDEP